MARVKDEEEEVRPLKPVLFDKRRLRDDDFRGYVYEINFSGKKVRDLKAEGYLHAAYPYIKDIDMQLVEYKDTDVGSAKPYRVAVVKCVLTLSYRTSPHSTGSTNEFKTTAFGDGDTREVKDATALVRIVETRALKRAIARALDIGRADIESEEESEEVGTPLQDNPASLKNPLAEALEKRREKLAQQVDSGEPVGDASRGDNDGWGD